MKVNVFDENLNIRERPEFIFVVETSEEYESSNSICAFFSEEEAKKFVEDCKKYERENPMPKFEDLDDSLSEEEYEKQYLEIEVKFNEWILNHPVGNSDVLDRNYSIKKIKMKY
jgi:hypothetical protein